MGLNLDEKKVVVAEVSAKMASAQTVVLAEYSGLAVAHLTRLRAQVEVLTPKWLLYCLRELWLSRYFAINCKEFVGQSAFNTDKLKEVEIPIPPIPEQERLVARIEAQTSRIETIRKAQQELIDDLNTYVPALLAKAFRGEL